MAGRGPARKPAGAAADKRNGKQMQRVGEDGAPAELPVTIPSRPRGLTAAVRRAWDDFWASDVAYLLDRSDLHAVRRLFQLYVEREHCYDVVTDRRVTRVPLAEAVKAGLRGELEYQVDDDGDTHTFVVVEHEGRVGIGSQGQMVLSPWAKDLRTIDAEIRQLEDRFGLNVRARTNLAVTVRPPAPRAPAAPGPTQPPPPDPASAAINEF
jgi:hypothetical protein